MHYFEREIFFPVLNASPESFPGKQEQLASVQIGVIDMLHNLYYPCETSDAMHQSIIVSLVSPSLRPLWKQLQTLGFLTMLDESLVIHASSAVSPR